MATEEEISEAEDAVISDVEEGIQSVTVDGMNVNLADPLRRMQALAAAKQHTTVDPFGSMRHKKLISPGTGGSG